MPKVISITQKRKNFTAESELQRLLVNREMARRHSGLPFPGAASHYGTPQAGAHRASAHLLVSVVIPTRGRPELLNRCMASLILQSLDPALFEIIVVDDGPDNATKLVVDGWTVHNAETGPAIRYIASAGPHGPAAARNIGWCAARAAIIAFTDDDTIATTDWLKNGVGAFDGKVHAVRGRIVMPLAGTPTDYQLDAKHLETAEFVTANCFCRKDVLEDLGGFDERFRFAWHEDSDLHFRLLDYQAQIKYAANAVVTHPIRSAPWGVSLQQIKKIQFDALLYKKHPALYRKKIRAQPRWDFYVTVAALLICLASMAAGASELGVMAGGVWLYLTGRFCLQRLKKTSKAPWHVIEIIVTSALIPPLSVFWRAVGAMKFRVGFL